MDPISIDDGAKVMCRWLTDNLNGPSRNILPLTQVLCEFCGWRGRLRARPVRPTLTPPFQNLSRSGTQLSIHNFHVNDGELDICLHCYHLSKLIRKQDTWAVLFWHWFSFYPVHCILIRHWNAISLAKSFTCTAMFNQPKLLTSHTSSIMWYTVMIELESIAIFHFFK